MESRKEDCFLLRTGANLWHGGEHEEGCSGDVCQLSGEILGQLPGQFVVEANVNVSVFSTVQCAQIIKQKMDESFGGAGYWNVVVGESFDVRKEDIW